MGSYIPTQHKWNEVYQIKYLLYNKIGYWGIQDNPYKSFGLGVPANTVEIICVFKVKYRSTLQTIIYKIKKWTSAKH